MMRPAKITDCDAQECVYNQNNKCHALAITVGGTADHMCDTFCPANAKGGDSSCVGMVGACKVSNCQFNNQFECSCSNIEVGQWGNAVDCLTYKSR